MIRTHHGTRRRLLLAPALAGAMAALSLPAAAFAAPSPPPGASPQAQAEAIIKPSIVYIAVEWKGWVRFSNGHLLSTKPTSVATTCSGFVASSTGYVVTAGHCVDDQTMRGGKEAILETVIGQLVEQGDIAKSEAASMLQLAEQNWKVEGTDAGSPPDRKVSVYQTVAASGVAMVQPLQATVVDVKAFSDGDVGLLKVEPPSAMPVLQVASDAPDNGTDIVAAGYPGSVSSVTDPKLDPSFKDGRTSSQQTVEGVPFTEISAATSPGMSGGPTVDTQGRVVGTVSFNPSAETQPFNFITSTATVRAVLARNGVQNTLSASDSAYRAGLAAYFAGRYHDAVKQFDKVLAVSPDHQQTQLYRAKSVGLYASDPQGPSTALIVIVVAAGVAVLVVVLVLVLLLLRSRRRKRAAALVPGAPAPGTYPAGAPAPGTYPGTGMPPIAPPPGVGGPQALGAAPVSSVPPASPLPPAAPTSPMGAGWNQGYRGSTIDAQQAAAAPSSAPPAPGVPPVSVPPMAAVPPVSVPPVSVPPAPAGAATVPVPPVPAGQPSAAPVPAPPDFQTLDIRPPAGVPALYCPSCGQPHAAEAHFCAACGQPLDSRPTGSSSGSR